MEQSFLTWYYTKGVLSAFQIWYNVVLAWWRKGNILSLFLTLFSPWHRDVSNRTWRGLHPTLWLEMIATNIFTRFMGSFMRSSAIVLVLIALVLIGACGLFLVFAYLTAPFLLVLAVLLFLAKSPFLLFAFVTGIIGFGVALYGYLHRAIKVIDEDNILSFQKSRIFLPVATRLGSDVQEQKALQELNSAGLGVWLHQKGLEEKDLQMAINIEKHFFDKQKQREHFWSKSELAKWSRIGKSWKYGYTVHLDEYSKDLSAWDYSSYRHQDLYGKQKIMEQLLNALERDSQNSVLLVGNPGIGKQSVVHSLARLIRENILHETLFDDMRVLWFDIAHVASDADARGEEVENNLRRLFTEATLAGNCILAIPHFENILLPDNKGRNFRPLIEEFLAYPNFRIIGLTNSAGKLSLKENAAQALSLLEEVEMTEPNEEETLLILLSEFHAREPEEGTFTLKALQSIITNAENIHWETPFPERAIDLAEALLINKGKGSGSLITESDVDDYLSATTGVPKGKITESEKDKLLHLEELLHARVIGQEKAIKQIAEALRKARAGFGDTGRPIGSFLFLGPTGVGKTETAKALANVYFGGEENMIRLDMSEYQTDEAVDRLIGSASKGIFGTMTTKITEAPYSILLLDELEKAYPRALDIFLQILDEGYVTDGYGQKINFRNCIIIATSNAGSVIQKQLRETGVPEEELERKVIDSIVETGLYRLEFLNRFDGVVFFLSLMSEEMRQVVLIKLNALASRLQKEKNISLSFEPGVAEALVEKGYDPIFGARSLNRFISDTLEDQIAKAVIEGKVASGGEMIIRRDSIQV